MATRVADRRSVLILSGDPLSAALLGAASELAAYAPVYPAPGESARDALIRLRPSVVLIDCDDDAACTEEFLGPVIMTGARLVVFSSARSRRKATPLAERFKLRHLELPADPAALARALDE